MNYKAFLKLFGCLVVVGSLHPSNMAAQGTVAFTLGNFSLGQVTSAQNLGWEFSIQQSIQITALGAFDNGRNGFTEPHTIQLWNSSGGSALSSVVLFGDGIPSQNSYAYGVITPIVLQPGNYIISASYGANSGDTYPTSVQSVNMDPAITFIQARSGAALAFPSQVGTGLNNFAPDFKFVTVPEPATTALLIIGVAGCASLMRKRRSC